MHDVLLSKNNRLLRGGGVDLQRKQQKAGVLSHFMLSRSLNSRFGRKISILLILMVCLVISFFYLASHEKAREIYENETKTVIVELKKSFLQSTVNNLVLRIDTGRESTAAYYRQSADARYAVLEQAQASSSDEFVRVILTEFGLNSDTQTSKWTVFIWDAGGTLLYAPEGFKGQAPGEALEKIKPQMAFYRSIEREGISCFYGYTKEHVESTVKETIVNSVRDLKFDNGSYIWINEILNYDGGDNYAIRLVHPNLPQTEGMYLSTGMADIKGNLPYLTELEGVKKDGELFLSYYFKELDSENISEKLTYAQLYPDYNWIICMGVQNNRIEEQILSVRDKMQTMGFATALQLLVVLLALVLLFLVTLLLSEKAGFDYRKKQMERQISHDSLTNAKSRSFGMDYLNEVFTQFQASEHKPTIALMLLDIDNFKSVNDRYGHCEGDCVLQKIVHAIYRTVRHTDELFRLGGDEFVGIFYDITPEHAPSFAGKILDAVSAITHTVGEETIRLSISVGISHFRETDADYCAALKRADEAMYQSKFEGGNKVTVR